MGLEMWKLLARISKRYPRSDDKTDPLWDLKKDLLKILAGRPTCLSELAIIVHRPTREVLRALKDMIPLVEMRKDLTESKKDEYQIWGISSPHLFQHNKTLETA